MCWPLTGPYELFASHLPNVRVAQLHPAAAALELQVTVGEPNALDRAIGTGHLRVAGDVTGVDRSTAAMQRHLATVDRAATNRSIRRVQVGIALDALGLDRAAAALGLDRPGQIGQVQAAIAAVTEHVDPAGRRDDITDTDRTIVLSAWDGRRESSACGPTAPGEWSLVRPTPQLPLHSGRGATILALTLQMSGVPPLIVTEPEVVSTSSTPPAGRGAGLLDDFLVLLLSAPDAHRGRHSRNPANSHGTEPDRGPAAYAR